MATARHAHRHHQRRRQSPARRGALQDATTATINITAVRTTRRWSPSPPSVRSTEQVAGTIDAAATITDVELGAAERQLCRLHAHRRPQRRPGGRGSADLRRERRLHGQRRESRGRRARLRHLHRRQRHRAGDHLHQQRHARDPGAGQRGRPVAPIYLYRRHAAGLDRDGLFVQRRRPGQCRPGRGGSPTGTDAITINITDTPENQPPTLDLDADDSNTVGTGYTASFTEGGAAVVITDTDVAITDADAGDMIEGATITITSAAGRRPAHVLGALPAASSSTGRAPARSRSPAPAPPAEYEAALEQITFSSTSDDPTAGGTTPHDQRHRHRRQRSEQPRSTTVVTVTDSQRRAGRHRRDDHRSPRTRSGCSPQADFGFTDPDGDAFASVTDHRRHRRQLYYDADGTGGAGLPVAVGRCPRPTPPPSSRRQGQLPGRHQPQRHRRRHDHLRRSSTTTARATTSTRRPTRSTFDVTPSTTARSSPRRPITTDEQTRGHAESGDHGQRRRSRRAQRRRRAIMAARPSSANRSVSNAEDVFDFNATGARSPSTATTSSRAA